MNIRRRPKRSPSAAPVRRKTAKVSVYAFTVHSSSSIDAPRSVRITGSAVETTRLSSTTMNSATEVIANVQRVFVLACIRFNSFLSKSVTSIETQKNTIATPLRRQPAISRSPHGVGSSKSRIASSTFSSIPFAKKALTSSGGAPLTRSISSTRSRQTRRRCSRISGSSAAAKHCSISCRPLAILDQLAVRLAHRVQRLLARLAARRALEGLVDLLHLQPRGVAR